ncbi:MAG: hypothetical protein LBQ54_09245 [Planctomycetaceae bacterium]|jgi:hypothetical protein|nr:hypothetical protein [Planctomycetaceae bacterium]
MRFYSNFIQTILAILLVTAIGCEVMPVRRFRPTLNNPFPEISEVAVVPFINASNNTMVDGREFAESYSKQLQNVPGFNVIPVSTVERAMRDLGIRYFSGVEDVRRLGKYLNADAVVIGTVNEFSSFQPPSLTFEVEWYATNPFLHPIPPGYLPLWGTPAEKEIPDKIVLEAERVLAREQLKTQTPDMPDDSFYFYEEQSSSEQPQVSDPIHPVVYLEKKAEKQEEEMDSYRKLYEKVQGESLLRLQKRAAGHYSYPAMNSGAAHSKDEGMARHNGIAATPYEQKTKKSNHVPETAMKNAAAPEEGKTVPNSQPTLNVVPGVIPPAASTLPVMPGMPVAPGFIAGEPETFPGLPANWPDSRGFIPDGPSLTKPQNPIFSSEPILRHVKSYDGKDAEFTRMLQDYESLFVDDRRIGGWQGILRRRTEFISFCCRMHIWEMLSSRGGAGRAEKIQTFPKN